MWMNPAKKMDQLRKTEKFIEHECCKWNKQIWKLIISLHKGSGTLSICVSIDFVYN